MLVSVWEQYSCGRVLQQLSSGQRELEGCCAALLQGADLGGCGVCPPQRGGSASWVLVREEGVGKGKPEEPSG